LVSGGGVGGGLNHLPAPGIGLRRREGGRTKPFTTPWDWSKEAGVGVRMKPFTTRIGLNRTGGWNATIYRPLGLISGGGKGGVGTQQFTIPWDWSQEEGGG